MPSASFACRNRWPALPTPLCFSNRCLCVFIPESPLALCLPGKCLLIFITQGKHHLLCGTFLEPLFFIRKKTFCPNEEHIYFLISLLGCGQMEGGAGCPLSLNCQDLPPCLELSRNLINAFWMKGPHILLMVKHNSISFDLWTCHSFLWAVTSLQRMSCLAPPAGEAFPVSDLPAFP